MLTQGYIDEENIGRDWRVRDILATQLGPLCDILELSDIQETLEPTFFKFATDPVANVRNSAHQATGPLLLRYQREKCDNLHSVVQQVVALVDSDHYQQRQIFVQICEKLLVAESTCVTITPQQLPAHPVPACLPGNSAQGSWLHGIPGVIFPRTSLRPVWRTCSERQASRSTALLDGLQRTYATIPAPRARMIPY